jgi:hypothetical protein
MIRNVLKQYLVDLDTSWERISYFLHLSDELKKFLDEQILCDFFHLFNYLSKEKFEQCKFFKL